MGHGRRQACRVGVVRSGIEGRGRCERNKNRSGTWLRQLCLGGARRARGGWRERRGQAAGDTHKQHHGQLSHQHLERDGCSASSILPTPVTYLHCLHTPSTLLGLVTRPPSLLMSAWRQHQCNTIRDLLLPLCCSTLTYSTLLSCRASLVNSITSQRILRHDTASRGAVARMTAVAIGDPLSHLNLTRSPLGPQKTFCHPRSASRKGARRFSKMSAAPRPGRY